jgi:hypothetical protein
VTLPRSHCRLAVKPRWDGHWAAGPLLSNSLYNNWNCSQRPQCWEMDSGWRVEDRDTGYLGMVCTCGFSFSTIIKILCSFKVSHIKCWKPVIHNKFRGFPVFSTICHYLTLHFRPVESIVTTSPCCGMPDDGPMSLCMPWQASSPLLVSSLPYLSSKSLSFAPEPFMSHSSFSRSSLKDGKL